MTDEHPRTRGDCMNGWARPCLHLACKHHLALDIDVRTGLLRFQGRPLDDGDQADELVIERVLSGQPTCALDVADAGEADCSKIAALTSISRQGVHFVSKAALVKLRRVTPANLLDSLPEPQPGIWDLEESIGRGTHAAIAAALEAFEDRHEEQR